MREKSEKSEIDILLWKQDYQRYIYIYIYIQAHSYYVQLKFQKATCVVLLLVVGMNTAWALPDFSTVHNELLSTTTARTYVSVVLLASY